MSLGWLGVGHEFGEGRRGIDVEFFGLAEKGNGAAGVELPGDGQE